MNRRSFLQAILAAGVAPVFPTLGLAPVSFAPIVWPDFETMWIPPGWKDKSDPLGQRGYAGAKCFIGEKVYSRVHVYGVPKWTCDLYATPSDGTKEMALAVKDLKRVLLEAKLV